MKKFYILSLLVIFFIKAPAQWVTIPDTNFAAFLQQNYPQCMNGNQMDTTCSAIVNATSVNCSNKNISDLTGIEYFDNLKKLNCNQNQLSFLPLLPITLDTLQCFWNNINVLFVLPVNLIHFDCAGNQISNLPPLPLTLKELIVYNNQISSLPTLPPNLTYLDCDHNLISIIPTLPQALEYLHCSYNQITSLPTLPNTLKELYCSNNQLNFLPTIPNSLTFLNFSKNNLNSLPLLPNTLKYLNCGYNQITSLPLLPDSLSSLHCYMNQLTSLPTLPVNLKTLWCSYNQITILPTFSSSITELYCSHNQITHLPQLPSSMFSLDASSNQLTSITNFPDSISFIDIRYNVNLTCIPQLKKLNKLQYTNTGIQCLPNYPQIIGLNPYFNPPLSTYPLCDIFTNPNNCDVFWNISGKVYNDDNNNCIDDAGEHSYSNMKLQLFQNGNLIQQVYSGSEGLYSFDTDTGTFTYTVDTTDLPVYVTCPVSGFHTSILTPVDSMDYNMDFAMQCKPGFDVGVKNIVRQSGQFFPGNAATIKIGAGDMASFYGLTCAAGVSGTVVVNFTGPISFISEAPGALVPSVSGNTLTYTIPDFGLVNFYSDFRIIVQTDTTAQAGNPVCFTVNVTPTTGDNDVSNNSLQHCFTVINSFDPNAKEVYPEGGITPSQEWMTYTIHFQNTGNAPAQNIYILDTLDQNLIPSSFTLLSYSHEPLTQLFGDVIKFNFPNINLPDSTNDEPNSHGFVQYKIKLNPNLPIGTIISNIAYNFFDFNAPVATNSVSNTVGLTSVIHHSEKVDILIFPNPTTNDVNISFNLKSNSEVKIDLYNSLGQIVKTISKQNLPAGKIEINFSVSELIIGVYHLKFSAGDDVVVKRVVRM